MSLQIERTKVKLEKVKEINVVKNIIANLT